MSSSVLLNNCKQITKKREFDKKKLWISCTLFGQKFGPRGTKPNETVRSQYEIITKPKRNHTEKQRNHQKRYETDAVLFAGI